MTRLSLLTGGVEKTIPPKVDHVAILEAKVSELENLLTEMTNKLTAAANRPRMVEATLPDNRMQEAFAAKDAECMALHAQLLVERGRRERAEGELSVQQQAVSRLEEQVLLVIGKNITVPSPTVITTPAKPVIHKPVGYEITGSRQDGTVMKMFVKPVEA